MEAADHFRDFLTAFNRLLEDVRAGRLDPQEKPRRKREIHDLAVDGVESWRAEHRRGWGHSLVLWALGISGRVEPPPPTPGRYLLHVLQTEYPEAIESYKRFFHRASGGMMPEPSTVDWLKDPWGGI